MITMEYHVEDVEYRQCNTYVFYNSFQIKTIVSPIHVGMAERALKWKAGLSAVVPWSTKGQLVIVSQHPFWKCG